VKSSHLPYHLVAGLMQAKIACGALLFPSLAIKETCVFESELLDSIN